ncbi:hypothetical protein PGH07_01195 [Sulfurovum sp. zt1-1]|uniref:Uncharacterized protein n=1 Tax=Sulfurovum zhangzhouensis TaxID=3019067 RepID=A0ABT7QVH3_9BACT|nr:hypothetical protein [Sulfurovum zhangzhouensis]MDM5270787.1 hypothetical protein [Sulfurovum zhangzhouensis]
MELKKKLDNFTKVPINRRRKAFKWLAKQDEEVVLMAFEKQKEYLFKIGNKNEENKSILYLSALYLAADSLYSLYYSQASKNRDMNIHAVQGVTRMQAQKFKKHVQADKYDRLLNLKNKILVLKDEENLSFRQISEFLMTYHRLKVSHSYVATFYNSNLKEKK